MALNPSLHFKSLHSYGKSFHKRVSVLNLFLFVRSDTGVGSEDLAHNWQFNLFQRCSVRVEVGVLYRPLKFLL